MRELDAFDRSLLDRLQADGSLTNEQLSQDVGLSPSAIHRRLRRLRGAGVIEGSVALVNPAKVGRPGLFVVGLEVERERPELVQPLRAWLRREAAIQQAYYVTGSTDYVLVVTAPDIAEFDGLMSRLMRENPNVRRFTTNVAMMTIKRSLAVPIG